MYITLAQLADRPGAEELSLTATPEHKQRVDYDLMQASLLGADRSEWDEEDVAVADEAISRINDAITNAASIIDGYLGQRGYLPLAQDYPIVTHWCRSITRYLLNQSRQSMESTDPVVRDYRDAIKLLEACAAGRFSLGADDALAGQTGEPAFRRGRTKLRDALRDF